METCIRAVIYSGIICTFHVVLAGFFKIAVAGAEIKSANICCLFGLTKLSALFPRGHKVKV